MTKAARSVSRETEACVFSQGELRPVIVTIDKYGHTMGFRLKRHRQTFSLSVKDCYYLAVNQWVEREREKKRSKRKASH